MVDILSGITEFTRGLAKAQPDAMDRRSREKIQRERLAAQTAALNVKTQRWATEEGHRVRAEADRATTEARLQRTQQIQILALEQDRHRSLAEKYTSQGMTAEANMELEEATELQQQIRDIGLGGAAADQVAEEETTKAVAASSQLASALSSPLLEMPGLAPPAGPPPAGPPSVTPEAPEVPPPPADPKIELMRRVTTSNDLARHTSIISDLMKTAEESPDLAKRRYGIQMAHRKRDEWTEVAELTFENAGIKNRRDIEAAEYKLWLDTVTRVSKPNSPLKARVAWAEYEREVNERFGGLTVEQAEKRLKLLLSYDQHADLTGAQKNQLGRIAAIKANATYTLDMLSDERLRSMLGGGPGLFAKLSNRVYNWQGREDDDWVVLTDTEELKLRSIINNLGYGVDMISRMMSGAALTETEVAFYSAILGSIDQKPEMIRQNMNDLLRNMTIMQETTWEIGYEARFGPKKEIFDLDAMLYPDLEKGEEAPGGPGERKNPEAVDALSAGSSDTEEIVNKGRKKKLDDPTADKGLPHFEGLRQKWNTQARDLKSRGLLNKWVMIEQDIWRNLNAHIDSDSKRIVYPEALGKSLEKHDWPEDEPIPMHQDRDLARSHRFMLDEYSSRLFSKKTGWTGGYDERGRKRQ